MRGSKPEYPDKNPDSLPAHRYHILEEKIQRPGRESNPHPPTLVISSPGQERAPRPDPLSHRPQTLRGHDFTLALCTVKYLLLSPFTWHVSMFDIHLRKTQWVYTVLDVPESKEITEQIDWRAKQPSQAACVSEDLKC